MKGRNEAGVSGSPKSLERNLKYSRLVLLTPTPPPLFLGQFKGTGDSIGQRTNNSRVFNLVLTYKSSNT